jgi:branched-chain amino acid aminotransferase
MSQESKKIWMDGKFIKWSEANVHVLTHTLHYGIGVFEGIRCYKTDNGPAIFRLKEHINRLFDSCHILQITPQYTPDELNRAVIALVSMNKLDKCYIRPLVYLGHGSMGIHPKDNPVKVAIAVWPWGAYLGEDGLRNGIKAKISSFTRHHVNVTMTKSKTCGDYVNSFLAKREAVSCGFDEALLLDTNGYVTEGSGQNIFIVRNGILKTPPVTSILEGITRNSVIEIAKNENLRAIEEHFTRDELYIADEVFLTGTATEITPIREVDQRVIDRGKPGPITKKLQSIFFKIVSGKEKKYRSWLSFI